MKWARPTSLWILSFLVLWAFLCTWLRAKQVSFHVGDYRNDVYASLQMSVSWLEGKHVLYENLYKDTWKSHNYYLILPLGIFVLILGQVGLFWAHWLLLTIAIFASMYANRSAVRASKVDVLLFLLCFLLGPTSFWIWDDLIYGWHLELLWVPLGLLFGLALRCAGWRAVRIVTGAAICLVKEDGALLALAIHLNNRFENGQGWTKRTGLIVCGWGLVLVSGLALLAYQRGPEEVRVERLFSEFFELEKDAQFAAYLWRAFGKEAILLLPFAIYILLVGGMRVFLRTAILAAPLLADGFFCGMIYYPIDRLGIWWQPRVALVWGFLLSAPLVGLGYQHREAGYTGYARGGSAWRYALFIFLFWLQHYNVEKATGLAQFDRWWRRGISPRYVFRFDDEIDVLKCFARKLPANFPIAIPGQYFHLFSDQDLLWTERAKWWQNPDTSEPKIFVCLDECESEFLEYSQYRDDFLSYRRSGLHFWVPKQEAEGVLEECLLLPSPPSAPVEPVPPPGPT